VDDEFRVEVELDDEEHGYSIGERRGRSISTTTRATASVRALP
jgi:hypothetical protein